MIQAMRKDEDDRLDEEADIMRELEMEEDGIPAPRKARVPEILVEDSQMAMPLGPDRGFESEDDSEDESGLGRDGKPRKVWKKKGLKRQTRRTNSKIYITLTEITSLTISKCALILSNLSQRQQYRTKTIQAKSRRQYQRHKHKPVQQ